VQCWAARNLHTLNVLCILLAHVAVQLDGDAYVTVLDTAIVRCIVRVDHNC